MITRDLFEEDYTFFLYRYPLMQSSTVVRLDAGKAYYIEGVESNYVGANHLSVGVQLPNGLLLRPIPGEFLNRDPKISDTLLKNENSNPLVSQAGMMPSSQLGNALSQGVNNNILAGLTSTLGGKSDLAGLSSLGKSDMSSLLSALSKSSSNLLQQVGTPLTKNSAVENVKKQDAGGESTSSTGDLGLGSLHSANPLENVNKDALAFGNLQPSQSKLVFHLNLRKKNLSV